MMREIKFRAKTLKGRKTIYGYYLPSNPIIPGLEKVPCIVDDEGYFYAIDKYTLQQLCGCDDNGEEVYEGDTVTDGENEYEVTLDDATLYPKNSTDVDHAPIYAFVKKKEG